MQEIHKKAHLGKRCLKLHPRIEMKTFGVKLSVITKTANVLRLLLFFTGFWRFTFEEVQSISDFGSPEAKLSIQTVANFTVLTSPFFSNGNDQSFLFGYLIKIDFPAGTNNLSKLDCFS